MADEPTPSDAPDNEPDPTPDPSSASSDGDLLDDEAIPESVRRAIREQGRRAIAEERKARKAAERKLAETLKLIEEHAAGPDQAEALRALETVKREAREEALATANARLLRSEIRLAAAGKIADPEDAIAFLDLSEFEVDGDGEFDTEAIALAIDALVEQKPYLAATARPTGTGGGGARPQTPTPTVDQQIADAEASGDIRTAMALKNRALADSLFTS